MNKHIHIHLPKGMSLGRKTKDAGFNEADHKRDHGKFATTSGDAAHHDMQEHAHNRSRAAIGDPTHPDSGHHNSAAHRHSEAAAYLRYARQAHGVGKADLAKAHLETAERAASQAKEHEAKLSTAQKAAGPARSGSGVEVKHQPGKTITHANAHLKPGGDVFSTHRSSPVKATYVGPDRGAGPNHHEIRVGNSRVSVPEHELHPTREAAAKAMAPAAADITSHPQYTKADHDYLKGKGWSDKEISQRWDEENKAGKPPQQVNKHNPPSITDI